MTICIGGLCDEGNSVVAISDKMVTGTFPRNIEFEHAGSKIEKLNDYCAVLISGSVLPHTDLLEDVKSNIGVSVVLVRDIVNKIKATYRDHLTNRIEERILSQFGFKDLNDFTKRMRELHDALSLQLAEAIHKTDLGLELIVCGVDGKGGHLYFVVNPGTGENSDAMGFCAIGSGALHAEHSLIGNGYSEELGINRASYFLYEAKRRAEVAPGVGKDSDMVIITQNDFTRVPPDCLEKMSGVYEERMSKDEEKTNEQIEEINVAEVVADGNNDPEH